MHVVCDLFPAAFYECIKLIYSYMGNIKCVAEMGLLEKMKMDAAIVALELI